MGEIESKKKQPAFIRFFTSLDTVTKVLVSLNVIAYILLLVDYKSSAIVGLNVEQLVNIGGITGDSPLITILLSMFAHYSLLHFVINMAVLILLSRTISANFHQSTYLYVYLLSGLGGNFITKLFTPDIVSIGASGSIYGLIGLLLICALFKRKYPDLNGMFMFIFVTAIVFIVGTFFSPMANLTSHIAGFVIGVIGGLIAQFFKLEVIRENNANVEEG
ncbi:rhomboid family intramembrane serine protease [Staphylococcus pettenkoferi]|uniref:rhomboid family intramembrane serine protease n=1 Tax=Staphylococcus pettenkoferi TaxID=170573 RepID=UPI002555F7B0|nr:rhomboid family intramembrane serine protease [Staphylococcus pettenkoferi]MDK7284279.1 rhomboid family intramembrane serine protease [Staphylococcus pettenkoferi]